MLIILVNCANVINGKIGFCACNSCSELEGDCDFHDQCRKGLRCGSNNCLDFFGFDKNTDCCYFASVGAEDFCSTDEPCEVNEGDCDSNDECQSHLFCGSNNCPDSLGNSSSADCCEPRGNKHVQMTLDLGPQNCISQELAVSVPLVQQKQNEARGT